MNGPPDPYAPNPYASNLANPYASNPYAAPQVQGVYDPSVQSPARLDAALYTSKHVALATFLGTPLGGAVLMALNEHRVGRASAAIKTLLAGLVGTGFLLTIGLVMPDAHPDVPDLHRLALRDVVDREVAPGARSSRSTTPRAASGARGGRPPGSASSRCSS